jgi:hypothetical protein
MKIVNIFAPKLYAFHYENEEDNELDRLLLLWNDPEYLYNFLKKNRQDITSRDSISDIAEQIIDDANQINDTFHELSEKTDKSFDEFFRPLDNNVYQWTLLSKEKGRLKRRGPGSYLRIYAIKVDSNIYVITGGAIKFTHLMQDRPHTNEELQKLEKCRNYLNEHHVTDEDSYYEFLSEEE